VNADNNFDKDKALRFLRDHNVVKCVIDYSGGNDEGGVDNTRVTYADGREELNPSWCQRTYAPMVPNPDTGKWERKTLTTEQERANECADAIEQPVYDRYSTFAGEFYVDGTVEYNVPEGKVRIDGNEQVSTWEEVGADL